MKTKIGLSAFVLAALLFLGLPLTSSSAYVAVSVGIAPPPIAVYGQPVCPAPGYIWIPGYWAYGAYGYYWVPGEWVLPPRVGLLWTPGYWAYNGGSYVFHDGYWGTSVGFYGGINYGYGYYGSGYYGGRWVGDTFHYNTAVSRVNKQVIHNTYVNRQVARRNRGARASFNGPGGVQAKPNARERTAAKANHIAPTSTQRSRVAAAKNDPALRAGNNRRQPKAAAVKTFENKHRPNSGRTEAAAKRGRASREAAVRHHSGAGNGTTAEKRSGAAGRGETGKPTNRVARTAHGAHAPVKASRNEHVARSHAGNATHARHSESRKVTNASHAVHHPQAAVHHQRVASHSRHVAPHHQRVASYHRQGSLHGRRMTSHARHTAPSRDHARTAKAGKNKGKKHGGHG